MTTEIINKELEQAEAAYAAARARADHRYWEWENCTPGVDDAFDLCNRALRAHCHANKLEAKLRYLRKQAGKSIEDLHAADLARTRAQAEWRED